MIQSKSGHQSCGITAGEEDALDLFVDVDPAVGVVDDAVGNRAGPAVTMESEGDGLESVPTRPCGGDQ